MQNSEQVKDQYVGRNVLMITFYYFIYLWSFGMQALSLSLVGLNLLKYLAKVRLLNVDSPGGGERPRRRSSWSCFQNVFCL